MAEQIHVNGPAVVYVGLAGGIPGQSLVRLGLTTDGVDGVVEHLYEEVFTDYFGPLHPHDKQQFLGKAEITVPLVRWDETVLQSVLAMPGAWASDTVGAPIEGQFPKAGSLINQQGLFYRLLIGSPYGDVPYNFPSVHLVGRAATKVGTRVKKWSLVFEGLGWTGTVNSSNPNTTQGLVLYNHDASGQPSP